MIQEIKLKLIRSSVVVCHNEDFDSIKTFIKSKLKDAQQEEIDELKNTVGDISKYEDGAFTYKFYNGNALIFFNETTIDSIAHESFHAVDHIIHSRGFEHTTNGEEVAYPLGYLVSEICKLFGIK